jgi:hypothetical protein
VPLAHLQNITHLPGQKEGFFVQICDIRGRMVNHSTLTGLAEYTVNLLENRPGIYFFRVFMGCRIIIIMDYPNNFIFLTDGQCCFVS